MLNEGVTFEFNCNAKYASTSVKCKLTSLALSSLLLGVYLAMLGASSWADKEIAERSQAVVRILVATAHIPKLIHCSRR